MQEKMNFRLRSEDVTDDLILRRCKNFKDALRLCRDCSPLGDKEILDEIEKRTGRRLDKSHFSESLSQNQVNRNFPPDLVQSLEDICDNWIPTRYLVLSRNHEMKPKKEAIELENEQLKAALAEKDKALETVAEFFRKAGVNAVRG